MTPLRSLSAGQSFRLTNAVAMDTLFKVVEQVKGKHTFADVTACQYEHDGRTCFQVFSSDLLVVPVLQSP